MLAADAGTAATVPNRRAAVDRTTPTAPAARFFKCPPLFELGGFWPVQGGPATRPPGPMAHFCPRAGALAALRVRLTATAHQEQLHWMAGGALSVRHSGCLYSRPQLGHEPPDAPDPESLLRQLVHHGAADRPARAGCGQDPGHSPTDMGGGKGSAVPVGPAVKRDRP